MHFTPQYAFVCYFYRQCVCKTHSEAANTIKAGILLDQVSRAIPKFVAVRTTSFRTFRLISEFIQKHSLPLHYMFLNLLN